MNTSSFVCGVVIGVAASMIMSNKKNAMMSTSGHSGGSMTGSMSDAADKAKDKIISMAMTGFGNTASSASNSQSNGSNGGSVEHKQESSVQSKESNLKMLKDFIRSNPEVKSEVEKILKESHTSIPGL